MNWLDNLFGPDMQQRKTEIAAFTLALLNGLNGLALHLFGWSLPDPALNTANGVLALALVLAFGSRMSRTEQKVDIVAAKQPTEATVVVVDKTEGTVEVKK
jgi:hydrogenase/urease accessory protein HupE